MDLPSTVKKHVATIHCSGELTLLERKLSNVLLLHAYDALLTEREHRLPVSMMCALCGFDSKDVPLLRKSLRSLVTTALEYNLLDDAPKKPNERGWGVSALLSRGEIKNGVCSYAYDERLAERLYDPDVYALINIAVQRKFESSFTLNLHENCLRFRAVGSTGWWDLPKFRKLVGATAVTYDEFRLLNNRVIKPAVAENNRFAEILLEPELRRGQGRGAPVVAIRFKVQENPQRGLFRPQLDDHDVARQSPAYRDLRRLGCSDRLALMAVIQDEAWAARVAEYVERKFKGGAIQKPGAYTAKLLESRAEIGPAPIEAERQETVAAQRDATVRASKMEDLRRRFEVERRQRLLASLTDGRRRELAAAYMSLDGAATARARASYDEVRGSFRGVVDFAFEAYVVRELLGASSEDEFRRWLATQPEA